MAQEKIDYFSGDPGSFVDPGSFSKILYHIDTAYTDISRSISASYKHILMRIFGGVESGPETNRLDFAGDTITLPLFCPSFLPHHSVLVFVR